MPSFGLKLMNLAGFDKGLSRTGKAAPSPRDSGICHGVGDDEGASRFVGCLKDAQERKRIRVGLRQLMYGLLRNIGADLPQPIATFLLIRPHRCGHLHYLRVVEWLCKFGISRARDIDKLVKVVNVMCRAS